MLGLDESEESTLFDVPLLPQGKISLAARWISKRKKAEATTPRSAQRRQEDLSAAPLRVRAEATLREWCVYVYTRYYACVIPLRSSKNRLLYLLKWDMWAFTACAALMLFMLLFSVVSDDQQRSQQETAEALGADAAAAAAELDPSFLVTLGWWLGAFPSLFTSELWRGWRAQITWGVVRLLFSLSSAPFFFFIVGPLSKLFTHTDPTGYSRDGAVTPLDPTGLSGYLSWITEAILTPKLFRRELQESFGFDEFRKLKQAVADAEEVMRETRRRNTSSAYKRALKTRIELDALLASIVTEDAASPDLFRACFPDKVLQGRYKRQMGITPVEEDD